MTSITSMTHRDSLAEKERFFFFSILCKGSVNREKYKIKSDLFSVVSHNSPANDGDEDRHEGTQQVFVSQKSSKVYDRLSSTDIHTQPYL